MKIHIERDGGIFITIEEKAKILIDPISYPSKRPDLILISHAHSDHVNKRVLKKLRNVPIILSEATYDLLFSKWHKKLFSEIHFLNDKEKIEVYGVEIEGINAGHCVGSLQFLINSKKTIVYTGDFNLDARLILQPARKVKSDILIIDSTFGNPIYIFPKRKKLYRDILKTVNNLLERVGRVIICSRKLGTSQELNVLLLSATFIDSPILVERSIAPINDIHKKYEGDDLVYKEVNLNEILNLKNGVVIAPLEKYKYLSKKSKEVIICTGWALTWKKNLSFPLSNHSDFNQLLDYVEYSNAELIIPVYGFYKEFQEYLANILDINAKTLDRKIDIDL